jgi:uncharacterized protein (TIGR00369 family)
MNELSVQEVQRIADTVLPPFVIQLGLHVDEVSRGQVVIRMPGAAGASRADGIVSGQAMSALADSAMVLALASSFGEFRPVATVDLHVSFLGGLRDTDVLAFAKVDRVGSSIAFASVLIRSPVDEEKVAARATATFALPRERDQKKELEV